MWVLILVLIFIAALFLILLFTERLKVMLILDTYNSCFKMTLQWFHWLRALIIIENSRPVLTLYFFNMKLYKRILHRGGKNRNKHSLLKLAHPEELIINAYYGFQDPYTTGIACGAVNSALQFIKSASINQVPDFTAEQDYILLDAKARVNMGTALMNLARSKIY